MATDTISALGAGSGVDVKSLATNLVEAERAPRKAAIEKKIKASEGSVSGYAAVKFVLGDLQKAFTGLKNQSVYNVMNTKNSQPNAFSVTTTAATEASNHTVVVTRLAQAQRTVSSGFATSATPIALATGKLTFTINNVAKDISIPLNNRTPQGIVEAVNASDTGIKAQLVNTGNSVDPFRILFTGQLGESNSFTLAGLPAETELTQLQPPTDAALTVDGVPITSSTNKIQGAIANTTLDLKSVSPKDGLEFQAASLEFSRDTSSIKTNLEALVASFNDASSMLGVVSDPKSTVETYGATLVGNSLVGNVRSQMRALVTNSVTQIKVPAAQIKRDAQITISSSSGKPTLIGFGTDSDGVAKTSFEDLSAVVAAINAKSSDTKVVASINANGDLIMGNMSGSEGNDINISGSPNTLNLSAGTYGSKPGYGTTEVPGTLKSSNPSALRDLGLSISAQGTLLLDAAKLNTALENNFEGVVTLLTGNQENLSAYSQAPGGVANASVKKITTMLDISSPLSTQTTNLNTKISAYKLELDKLEARMTSLLARYNKQFAAMESMVGQTKAMKEGLTSTFEGMMAAYTNK